MNTTIIITVTILMVVIALAGLYYYAARQSAQPSATSSSAERENSPETNQPTGPTATIETDHGIFTILFYEKDAPKTVTNFIKLAKEKFYDGLIFHRIIKGFMIQGGDPNCTPSRATGMCGAGGPGYQFADELNPATPSYLAGYQKGVVAMANAGPNTNGSQFFVMLQETPLPHQYSIFGKVVAGQEVVDAIGATQTGAQDRPITPVVIKHISIE